MGEVNKTNNYTDFFYHAFRNILIIGIPLVIISALVLSLPHSSAEVSGSTDNVSLTLSTSCTVNAVVTSEHTVSLNGGQLDNNVGNTKLSAYCNDNNGYSIYAVGSSNNIDGNTDLVNTINESYNIRTGVYNDTIQTNPSSWAMKLTSGTGTGIDPVTGESVPTTPPTIINGYDNYSVIPNVYTQVAKRTSGTSMTTDTSISGSYLDTTYQIYANSAQPAGTYNGKVKYAIVHPNSNNNYLDFNEVFNLYGKTPVMMGGNKVYYAMQDMTSAICNSVSLYDEASQTQLIDTRDNKIYWIAKLQDGHCWMTQNLDLDLGPAKPLTSNDTDLTDHSLAGAYADNYSYDANTGITTWTPIRKTIDFTGDNGVSVSGWTNNNDSAYSASKIDDFSVDHSSLGNYYNWSAAIASNNSRSLSVKDLNAKNSICPRGWRLPSKTNNEFATLNNLYNNGSTNSDTNLITAPLWFVRAGRIDHYGFLAVLDNTGYYISSTVYSSAFAYRIDFNNNLVDPEYYDYHRGNGFTVRCIAR